MTQKLKHSLKLVISLSWIITISLYSVAPTFAKDRPGTVPKTTPRLDTHSRSMTVNNEKIRILDVKLFSPDGKELTTKLSPEAKKKITAAIAKSLKETGTCPVYLSEEGVGNCFGTCLRTAGVSPIQIILCGTSCALWETGVGLIICAVCVALDVTVVSFCATGCVAYAN